MRFPVLCSMALTVAVPGLAHATTVYPGCAAPALKPSHHTFYIDPVNGSQSGDGSAAKPWHTLAEVLDPAKKLVSSKAHNTRTFAQGDTTLNDINPTAPIKAGDVLMLKSGNHGSVKILNTFNSDFITVEAAPGQTPVVSFLQLTSAAKWIFQGIKFVGTSPAPIPAQLVQRKLDGLVSIGYGDYLGTTNNVIVDSSTLSSSDDTSHWTDTDWILKPYYYSLLATQHTFCVSFTNNYIYNGLNGIQLASDQSVAQGNIIERFSNDGIDIMASDLLVRYNTIRNGNNVVAVDPFHPDGIQGWSLTDKGVLNTNRNITIDSNHIIKVGNTDKTQMQGITIFDGNWDGVTITNNEVVSNLWHGIALYGVQDTLVANNTVIASDPVGHPTWILANLSKNGSTGKNVVIRNNIATRITISSPSASADHNVATSSISLIVNGKPKSIVSGSIGDSNYVRPSLTSDFTKLDPVEGLYQLQVKPTSFAVGLGTKELAPKIDIKGKTRSPTVDAGAYNH